MRHLCFSGSRPVEDLGMNRPVISDQGFVTPHALIAGASRWQRPCDDHFLALELKELLSAISGNRPPQGDIREAVENLKIVERLYEIGGRFGLGGRG